jgi:glycosyltransferase involved in cell wall biosynthesis
MRVSIIIPTRNEERVIQGAIEQYIPFLDTFDLEIIVSDANSTDRTAVIVREMALLHGTRVRLVQKTGPQNIAIGRNAGAAIAGGELLFHTDADVRIADIPHYFTTIQRFFGQPEVVAATVPIEIYPQEETSTDRFYHFLMNAAIRWSIPLGWCMAKGECQLVRRTAFQALGGYNEKLIAGEDCNLFYRLHKRGKVRFIRTLTVYHSPRRFREYGYWKLSYVYLMEGLCRLLVRRSFSREWRVVR